MEVFVLTNLFGALAKSLRKTSTGVSAGFSVIFVEASRAVPRERVFVFVPELGASQDDDVRAGALPA
jgi:hypothetical protein